jgi:ATP-dependent Clp protease ATP-binding subunit ClpX
MTEPKNAIVKQYKKLVEMDDVVLEVEDDAIREIAKRAMALKTGARGLRTIFESIMLDTMYELPDDNSVEKIIIDNGDVLIHWNF